jgi:hypothetical protein
MLSIAIGRFGGKCGGDLGGRGGRIWHAASPLAHGIFLPGVVDRSRSEHTLDLKKLGSAVKDEGKPLQKDRWRWICYCATYACRMETVDRKEQNTEKR